MASLAHSRRYKTLVDTTFKENMGTHERVPIYYWYWRTLGDIVKACIKKEKEIAVEYAPRKTDVDDRDVGSRVEFYELNHPITSPTNSHHQTATLIITQSIPCVLQYSVSEAVRPPRWQNSHYVDPSIHSGQRVLQAVSRRWKSPARNLGRIVGG
jgi:hypothetical protein